MIEAQCFQQAWIKNLRKKYPLADPVLLEKTIYAFELLGNLVKQQISFVFKGGTSALLLVKDFRRLSIDIDILCKEPVKSYTSKFDLLVEESPFKRWEEDPRTLNHIPKKHFKFYFDSLISTREDYILLDVLNEESTFNKVQKKPITSDLFTTDSDIKVNIPTIDGLIGDKLTAFAPATIGIPIKPEKSMQLIKQVFDLGELYLHISDFEELRSSYKLFLKAENKYRKSEYTINETLTDTYKTALLICQIDLRGGIEDEWTAIIRRGIKQIPSHLLSGRFTHTEANIAAARAVVLAGIAGSDFNPALSQLVYEKEKLLELADHKFGGELEILNRLKTISPEVYYYWRLFKQSQ